MHFKTTLFYIFLAEFDEIYSPWEAAVCNSTVYVYVAFPKESKMFTFANILIYKLVAPTQLNKNLNATNSLTGVSNVLTL